MLKIAAAKHKNPFNHTVRHGAGDIKTQYAKLRPHCFILLFIRQITRITMPQQLVVTAIGPDKTGIVSKLARLVTECNCNIIDSRMAIFGNEFTFIMLLAGDLAAISRIEHLLPALGLELDLTTMTKRTTGRPRTQVVAHYILDYCGPDRVGTLGAITGILAAHNIYIGSLQSETRPDPDGVQMHTQMTLELPEGIDAVSIEQELFALMQQLGLTGYFQAQQ